MLADKCINLFNLFGNLAKTLVDAVFWNITSYKRKRIDVGVSADYRTGVKNAVAAYLYMVTEHCAELFNICVNLIAVAKNSYKALVTLEV